MTKSDSPVSLPEVIDLHRGQSRVRVPPSIDVPLTDRVRRMLDTPPMRRLASVSQLGLVSLVYPGATHSRLEHSLGVYANALRLLDRLIHGGDSTSSEWGDPVAQQAFLVAALTHDVGHWPFCHPIEDMGESEGPGGLQLIRHEDRVEAMLREGPLAECLRQDWDCRCDDVMAILRPKTFGDRPDCRLSRGGVSFYASCLSGPIDIDKVDYLQRDSLHAGVPYGRNFDPDRILAALRPHPTEPKLAIGEKGRTAAEMLVFGRYVMFSEVYWHHTVRSATAMLQRVLFELKHRPPAEPIQGLNLDSAADSESAVPQSAVVSWPPWTHASDHEWTANLLEAASDHGSLAVKRMAEGLFGPRRELFKRVAEYNVESENPIHSRLARRPYWWMVSCSRQLAGILSSALRRKIPAEWVLIDAPPVKLEVDINIDVVARNGKTLPLGDVSPVVSVLANRQFDNHVKRVRVFVPAEIRRELVEGGHGDPETMQRWLDSAIRLTEQNIV